MKKFLFVALIGVFGVAASVCAQSSLPKPTPGSTMTQGEFARLLVKGVRQTNGRMAFNLQGQLPLAYSEDDCILILERYGVSPLRGWDRNAVLTQSDYTAIVTKLTGDEKRLHDVAQSLCDLVVINLNTRTRQDMLQECPYGDSYRREGRGSNARMARHKHLHKTPFRFWLFEKEKKPAEKK